MAETKENQTFLLQDVDYIKLTKNSRGYTWDIKVIGHDVEKLKKLNEELEKNFQGASISSLCLPKEE